MSKNLFIGLFIIFSISSFAFEANSPLKISGGGVELGEDGKINKLTYSITSEGEEGTATIAYDKDYPNGLIFVMQCKTGSRCDKNLTFFKTAEHLKLLRFFNNLDIRDGIIKFSLGYFGNRFIYPEANEDELISLVALFKAIPIFLDLDLDKDFARMDLTPLNEPANNLFQLFKESGAFSGVELLELNNRINEKLTIPKPSAEMPDATNCSGYQQTNSLPAEILQLQKDFEREKAKVIDLEKRNEELEQLVTQLKNGSLGVRDPRGAELFNQLELTVLPGMSLSFVHAMCNAMYRKIAIKYHPDTNKTPEALLRMTNLNNFKSRSFGEDENRLKSYLITRGFFVSNEGIIR